MSSTISNVAKWAVKNAETACISAVSAEGGGTGEATAGKARKSTFGIDPDGKRTSYKRESQEYDAKKGQGRKDTEQAGWDADVAIGQGGRFGAGDKDNKRRRLDNLPPQPCLKCNKYGYRMSECRSASLCTIMAKWPKALQHIAKMARLNRGVQPYGRRLGSLVLRKMSRMPD